MEHFQHPRNFPGTPLQGFLVSRDSRCPDFFHHRSALRVLEPHRDGPRRMCPSGLASSPGRTLWRPTPALAAGDVSRLLSSIPLRGCSAAYLSTPLVTDVWVASSLGWHEESCYEHFHTSLGISICFHCSWVNSEGWNDWGIPQVRAEFKVTLKSPKLPNCRGTSLCSPGHLYIWHFPKQRMRFQLLHILVALGVVSS